MEFKIRVALLYVLRYPTDYVTAIPSVNAKLILDHIHAIPQRAAHKAEPQWLSHIPSSLHRVRPMERPRRSMDRLRLGGEVR